MNIGERLTETPPGVRLCALDEIADGQARNFVLEMKAGIGTTRATMASHQASCKSKSIIENIVTMVRKRSKVPEIMDTG